METNKNSLNGATTTKPESNPTPPPPTPTPTSEAAAAEAGVVVAGAAADVVEPVQPRNSSRTPFTSLSQVDADLALARTLQEQERAYMMLRMGGGYGGGGSDYGSDDDWETDDGENHDHDAENGVRDDEDAFDANAHEGGNEYETEEEEGGDGEGRMEIDATAYGSDEAFAMALQEEEERELNRRMMALAGIQLPNWQPVDHIVSDDEDEDDDEDDDDGHDGQEPWQEVDPDELSYEELVALGDVVGTQSRGLSANTIASLPSEKYKAPEDKDDNTDTCVICRLDFEDDEDLTVLLCKHSYHPDCINNWLQINKVCPICNAEVS